MKRASNELHNLFTCDYLICRACHTIIWMAPSSPAIRVYFREITSAYYGHVKKCFALKRLILTERKK